MTGKTLCADTWCNKRRLGGDEPVGERGHVFDCLSWTHESKLVNGSYDEL